MRNLNSGWSLIILSVFYSSFAFGNSISITQLNPNGEISPIYSVEYSDCSILKRSCSGIKKWKNGDRYEGYFRFGKPHGQGKFTWADGTSYKGEFHNGVPHGVGKETYPDGSFYEGEWWDGIKSGEGLYSFACGEEYLGNFENDFMEGEGTIIFNSGESYSGEWKKNKPDGFGIYSKNDGSQFVGRNKEGEKEGEGMVIWESGDTLKGNWVAGKMDNQSTFIFNDGARLMTFWDDGNVLDEVIYTTAEGEEFGGKNNEIAAMIISNNFNMMTSVEHNLQLAWYSMAMECKTQNNLDQAMSYLTMAMSFENLEENSEIINLVNSQFAQIKSEAEQSGVASKNQD